MGRNEPRMSTDEGLAPAPHRRDCGLTPLSCRLPLKGGVMDPASPEGYGRTGWALILIMIVIVILIERLGERQVKS